MTDMALTDKQRRFVQEYLLDSNATQAAIRAGYSEKTAEQIGHQLLKKTSVAAAIAKLQVKMARKAEVTIESLACELEEARTLALTQKQSAAAVSATMGKAKLFGLGVENNRLSGMVQVSTVAADKLEALSDDELDLLEQAYPILSKLGLVVEDQDADNSGDLTASEGHHV